MILTNKLDNTALTALDRCEQEYVWRHVRHLAAPASPAAHFGQVVHAGIRALYDDADPEQAVRDAWGVPELVAEMLAGGKKAHLTVELALQYVWLYHQEWMQPERMFTCVWNEGYAESETECGFPDRCVRSLNDGLLYACDLKTTGMYPTAAWMRSFEHSQQVAMQLDILEATLKQPIAGFWLDAMHIGKGRPVAAHLMRHGPMVYSAALRAELRAQRALKAQRANDLQQYPQAALKSPSACVRYNSLCPYFDICQADVDRRDTLVQIALERGTLREDRWQPSKR